MELFPREELKGSPSFNFAPMIDFLFLMLALFATLAVSRAALYDTEIDLVNLKPQAAGELTKREMHPINISISAEGNYKWLTEFQEHPMPTAVMIQEELARQYKLGVLPQDKSQTEILLHIDRKAPWEPIANVLFAIREIGFSARPVYEPFSAAAAQ